MLQGGHQRLTDRQTYGRTDGLTDRVNPTYPTDFVAGGYKNRAPILYYIKLCASFQSHRYIQTGVTVWKRSIRVKISNFFVPHDFENWRMTLENNRAPPLYYVRLCAPFQIHWWSQTWVTARKCSSPVKLGKRASLLCCFKLCASFHCHMKIQTGVTVRKRLNGVMTFVTLTFDLDPLHGHLSFNGNNSWEFEDDMMTGTLSKRCETQTDRQTDRRTDGQTDRQTDNTIHRAAWSQLKISEFHRSLFCLSYWQSVIIFQGNGLLLARCL